MVDPRLFQIATLAGVLSLGVAHLDVAASMLQAVVTISAALATQSAACLLLKLPIDWRSPLITGLSLTLLLRSNDPETWAVAGLVGVGSKFVLRWRGKHLLNPACAAIVFLLASGAVWVAPGQWGGLVWSMAGLAAAAALVLSRTGRVDVAAAFLGGYVGLLILRCLWLGDPWTIPLHQVQSGALLIFAFFMITDPRTTPDSRVGRIVFGLAVAGLAYHMQFGWQMRDGLYYALAIASVMTPMLDRFLPAQRFRWRDRMQAAQPGVPCVCFHWFSLGCLHLRPPGGHFAASMSQPRTSR